MKKCLPMLRNLIKEKKFHDMFSFQSNDRNKFGLGFDEKFAKKVSTKSKLKDVFIKKQSIFKSSSDSKKDSVFNKCSSTNNYIHNDRNFYSRRPNSRFSNRSFFNSKNVYSNEKT